MWCGFAIEIAMLVMGIIALVTGKARISGDKVLVGKPARIVGLILCLPLPLDFGAAIALAASSETFQRQMQLYAPMLFWGIVLGCSFAAVIIGLIWGKPPRETREASGQQEHNPLK